MGHPLLHALFAIPAVDAPSTPVHLCTSRTGRISIKINASDIVTIVGTAGQNRESKLQRTLRERPWNRSSQLHVCMITDRFFPSRRDSSLQTEF